MLKFVFPLNKDQYDNLAKLCFDMSKGTFFLTITPAVSFPVNPVVIFTKILFGLATGLVFIYCALVLLKMKEQVRV